jgi:hypothetical protein
MSYYTILEEPPPRRPLEPGWRAGHCFPRKKNSLIPQQTIVQTVPPTASWLQDLFLGTLVGSWFQTPGVFPHTGDSGCSHNTLMLQGLGALRLRIDTS